MLNLQNILIKHFIDALEQAFRQTYGTRETLLSETIRWVGQLALENLSNSDALYHNTEHTIMVTLVGQAILKGKHLLEGGVTPRHWLHFTMALLCHDIGFVRGICQNDNGTRVATGIGDETVEIPYGGTDAALTPYHVDRSKLFIRERFQRPLFLDIDTDIIANYIEMTRFPIPEDEFYQQTNTYAGLVRAADFIGQLGDPGYLRKIPALFYEFEETGLNKQLGYENPEQMRQNYSRFYWNTVNPYIQDALRFLRLTQEGKQWVANLHAHVFDVEHMSGGK